MKTTLQALLRLSITSATVIAALVLGRLLWNHYMYAPWTRDGRLRAEVVRISPDVSGLVARVAVEDNEEVRQGDLLFEIDPERFRFALRQAEADLAAAKANARAAGANVDVAHATVEAKKTESEMRQEQAARRQALLNIIPKEERTDARSVADAAVAALRQAQASGHQAGAAREQADAAVALAQVTVDRARLDLERTKVRAPVDGYVTNLEVRKGDYATAGEASVALVDRSSFYVYGYFEETKIPALHVGDRVIIQLLSGGVRFNGRISGVARGITDRDNPTGESLLADVNPTFNWVRLAQRVPVRIAIDETSVPRGVTLSAGMTATIEVRHNGHGALAD